ncbi:MAG: hypothetical protein JWN76_1287 [Chitinophagaceae bacterium]|nr:hypothetical protein [Chitinophagaceae bacterium]
MPLVSIRSYDNYFDAALAQGVLESAGIDCFLQDVHSVTINPVLTNAIGGIKLRVRSEDYEQASNLLSSGENKDVHPQCPDCGSVNTSLSVDLPSKTWFSLLLEALTSSSLSSKGQLHYQCNECKVKFRD